MAVRPELPIKDVDVMWMSLVGVCGLIVHLLQ